MSAKHTLGPWAAMGDHDPARVVDDEGNWVAELTRWEHAENVANAHLIAAAPDMLEALEMHHRAASTIPYAQWTTEMHKADAAIKKARGEK